MTAEADIAVVAYHLRPGRVSLWQVGGYGVPGNYVDAVRRAGGFATLVLPGDARGPAELLERRRGLLLVGAATSSRRASARSRTSSSTAWSRTVTRSRSTSSGRPTAAACRPSASVGACRS